MSSRASRALTLVVLSSIYMTKYLTQGHPEPRIESIFFFVCFLCCLKWKCSINMCKRWGEISEDMFPSLCLIYWRRWLKSILSYLGKIAVHLPRSARCKEICWGLYSPLWSVLPISTSYSAICPHMGLLRMSARIPQPQEKSWALQKLVAQVKTASGQLWLMHLFPLT